MKKIDFIKLDQNPKKTLDFEDVLDDNKHDPSDTTFEEEEDQNAMFMMYGMMPIIMQQPMSGTTEWLYSRLEKWEMLSNFRISNELINDLNEKGDGVEAVVKLTPYRAIVAIAPLFNVEEVKIKIKRLAGAVIDDNQLFGRE